MASDSSRTVVVCGVTGRQGGAVARHLLADGWHVRGVTRSPRGKRALAMARLGVELVQADMADRRSLERAFEGAHAVYSVQNPVLSGLGQEIVQGANVASTASSAGVSHLVYGSAGVGSPTGVGSWDSKLAVEAHMRELALPVTVLRPMAFMELMTDRAFYPPISTWRVMPKLLGPATKVPWLAVEDLGRIAATTFGDPDRFVGQTIMLAADAQAIDDCRAIWKEERGRPPLSLPMPVRMFERLAGTDLTTMWRWARTGPVPLDVGPTRSIHPGALTVREWLRAASPS